MNSLSARRVLLRGGAPAFVVPFAQGIGRTLAWSTRHVAAVNLRLKLLNAPITLAQSRTARATSTGRVSTRQRPPPRQSAPAKNWLQVANPQFFSKTLFT